MAGLRYRPEIDGLRAVAVISIVSYHFGAARIAPGGFTGVDVFFVISGFLITSVICNELQVGSFSFAAFYSRRFRRIAPALIAVVIVTVGASYFLLLPGDYASLGASAAASLLGVSNFYFNFNTGYFDQAAELLPLLHTWSLGVEEQFYLLWPVLLSVCARFAAPRKRVYLVFGFVAAAVLVAVQWSHLGSKAAFYMAPARAWELGLGALLVFMPSRPTKFGEPINIIGLALIGFGIAFSDLAEFGLPALIPCIGATLIIWPSSAETVSGRILGLLRPIGLISYSLYLWHWPVWVLFRIYINGYYPSTLEAIELTVFTFLLATASYWFIERPFRSLRPRPRTSAIVGVTLVAPLVIAALMITHQEGFPARVAPQANALRNLDVMWDWPCASDETLAKEEKRCVIGVPWKSTAKKAILWGDSNAEHLVPLLSVGAIQSNASITLAQGCPPILDGRTAFRRDEITPNYNSDCGALRSRVLDLLEKNSEVEVVIVASSWSNLLPKLVSNDPLADHEQIFLSSFNRLIEEVLGLQKKLVVVATIPQWDWPHDPTKCNPEIGLPRRPCAAEELNLLRTRYVASQADINLFRQLKASNPSITLIVPGDGLCPEKFCVTEIDGQHLYRDANHLRRNLPNHVNDQLLKLSGVDALFLAFSNKSE